MKRLYFVAGESSGDMHGSNLIRAIRIARPEWICEGLGGRLMAEAGMTLHRDLAGEGIMGFVEVLRKLGAIRRLFHETVAYLERERPDVVVFIDYPGFNLRLAAEVRRLGINVVYYISPQVWAWKKRRIHTIARLVDKMLVIFPFEEALYRNIGVPCAYVGHPLLDHIARYAQPEKKEEAESIALLPGSREQEIRRIAPVMVETARRLQERRGGMRFVAACVNESRAAQLREIAGDFPLDIRVGGMYDVLSEARFALVASGTATLETALFRVPMAILYRVNPLTYWMARLLVNINHIGIVNILAGKEIVPEFIQYDATPEKISAAVAPLIADTPERYRMLAALDAVRHDLGDGGASVRAAGEIIDLVEKTSG